MTIHIPVLVQPILELLDLKPGDVVIDGTLGGGGHSLEFLKAISPNGRLIGIDRDPLAVEETAERLNSELATCMAANYSDIPEIVSQMGIDAVDAILLDLGLSSDQLTDYDRGFSFHSDGPLDLRFNMQAGEPAWRLVNRLGEKHLADIIYQYGEERYSRRVARKICKVRHDEPIKSAKQLADLVRSCVPRSRNHSIDSATRTFQALRIAVNEELKWLKVSLNRLPKVLKPGGRIAIISFHSLEDRLVKTAFSESTDLNILTKRPITADEAELEANPRSRSAKLRVAERRKN